MKTSTFALIFGVAYLLIGLMGLVPLFLVPPPIDAPPTHFTLLYGYLLGLFPVNLLHSVFHIAIGALGISASSGRINPIRYARDVAIAFGVLAIMGMFPGLNTVMGIMPVYGHDVWLHAITALAAAHFGWRARSQGRERRHSSQDRRQRSIPVARERRYGLADRRETLAALSAA
jgi:hypothetical protein